MTGFIIGMMLGGCIGVAVMCLIVGGKGGGGMTIDTGIVSVVLALATFLLVQIYHI